MDNLNSPNNQIIRPRFLTFLCYLTLFGSSWSIMQSFSTLGNPEQISIEFSKSFQELQSQLETTFKKDPKTSAQVELMISNVADANTSSNMRDNSIFSLISNLLTMIGAMFMLRLKRNGFRFYVLGTLIGIVSPLVVFGATNLLGFSYAFYLSFIGAIFITLYAFKLKYME